MDEVLIKIQKKLDDGLLTKKGIAKYLGISQQCVHYKFKKNNWLYREFEKLKELS
jgi:hypothetical protein